MEEHTSPVAKNIGHTNSTVIHPSLAARYTREDSFNYYLLSNKQVYVCRDSLNDEGKALRRKMMDRVEAGDIDGVISPYCVINERSGAWIPDRSSDYYEGENARLQTYNNKVVHGILHADRISPIITSAVIMLDNDWVLTYNKSLYKLEDFSSESDIIDTLTAYGVTL